MTRLNQLTLPMICVVLGLTACTSSRSGTVVATNPQVRLQTTLGDIQVELYADRAPITTTNFLKYVDDQRYDSATFFRVVTPTNQPNNDIRIEVIQGGLGRERSHLRLPPIDHESTDVTGILHNDGVISMARSEPGTAAASFFICIGDQPELDFGGKRNPDGQGFAAFGKVIKGMGLVRRIQRLPERGQTLASPVLIKSVRRVDGLTK